MPDVIVVGDGPAGLSAALFTAKNGLDTVVFGTDDTSMHKAYLYNYLGIEEIHGTEFMETARDQVRDHGAELVDRGVVGSQDTLEGFEVSTEFDAFEARYLVLATGYVRDIAEHLGCEFKTINDTEVVAVDRNNETSVDNVYAAGWTTRPEKIQAAVSVGAGAIAALDILSTEKGQPFRDFDVPPDA
jgi:thioredoxin reductase